MSSIVSDFLINPVGRTIRRFTADSGTGTDAGPVRPPLPHDFSLAGDHGEVIADCDGPALSFPGLSFMRGPDVALGARSPPLLIPQRRRHLLPQSPTDDALQPSIARTPSPSIFEMDPTTIDTGGPVCAPGSNAPAQDQQPPAAAQPAQAPPDEDLPMPDALDPVLSRRLPADDGMSDMRQRIMAIQSNAVLNLDQKRYLMQRILTEGYARAKHVRAVAEGRADSSLPPRLAVPGPQDPTSSTAPEAFFSIGALDTIRAWTGLEDDEQLPIHVTEKDKELSYRVREQVRNIDEDHGIHTNEETEIITELGCQHYKRNVKVQCAHCEKWYPCRLCHDEVEEHVLPRKLTKHMLCMLCKHPQKASETCTNCGEAAASYFCNICKLWSDDVDKHIYHCDECGICRVGHGLEKDFFHCKTCRACISISTRDDHKCIERATDANCPICGDNMFDSPLSVIFMECGHPIHKSCFHQHMETSYKCPICNKSIVKMDALFLNLANIIKEQPMPKHMLKVRVVSLCNDCSAKSSDAYHYLGQRCKNCQSFNTVELQRLGEPEYDDEEEESEHDDDVEMVDEEVSPPESSAAHPYADASTQVDCEDELDHQFWGRVLVDGSEGSDNGEGDQDDGESETDDTAPDEDSEDDDSEEDIVLHGHR